MLTANLGLFYVVCAIYDANSGARPFQNPPELPIAALNQRFRIRMFILSKLAFVSFWTRWGAAENAGRGNRAAPMNDNYHSGKIVSLLHADLHSSLTVNQAIRSR
jgi:hypothetical protein